MRDPQPIVLLPNIKAACGTPATSSVLPGPLSPALQDLPGYRSTEEERGQTVNNQNHQPADQKCSAPGDVQQAPALVTRMTVDGVETGGGESMGFPS